MVTKKDKILERALDSVKFASETTDIEANNMLQQSIDMCAKQLLLLTEIQFEVEKDEE
jgi:hypothetical protein